MIRYWYWFKYFLLGISLSLLIILTQGKVGNIEVLDSGVIAQTVNLQATQHNQARLLTQKGHEQLNQGQAAAALKTWQEASKIYRQLRNQEGVTGSLLNQSLALQSLGLYPRACTTLIQALDLESWVCQSPNQMEQVLEEPEKLLARAIQEKQSLSSARVFALRNLGDVLRLIGKLDESEIVLQKALAMAKDMALHPNTKDILLSLANTERTLYNQARNKYQITDEPIAKATALKTAQFKAKLALNFYQQTADSYRKKLSRTALEAQLNRLSFFLELGQHLTSEADGEAPVLKTLENLTQSQIHPLLKQLLTAHFEQLPPIESVYAQLNFANSLMQISQSVQLNKSIFPEETKPLLIALPLAQKALQVAQNLNNQRAESYALGTIGKIYSHLEQTTQARQYLEKAIGSAQSIQAWDIAYQWQQQLGHLYQQIGNLDRATALYAAAVSSLDQVRGNILSVNSEIQFSFKEKVEPVYKEYLRLLLAAPKPNLEQVIQTNEQLQLAELENFLQCGKLDLVSLDKIQTITPATVIYVIDLNETVEVIARFNDGSINHRTLDPKLVKRYAASLLNNLQDERFRYTDERRILPSSQALYKLLIAPLKSYLPNSGTLVFVLDSSFQGLPMALLHDGNDYLLKQYSISVTLGSQLRQPQALAPKQLKALVAGLSKASPSFKDPSAPRGLKPLPEVEIEIRDVRKNTTAAVELLNEKFTSQQFQTEMNNNDFPIVHITTHGQFSSDPAQTVLFAWDKLIDVQQINRLLRAKTQGTQDSIELLVLSACQTAKGDKRSALGIAGVAAQAGARSTVASLWLVDEVSTARLMGEFYKGLKNGLSKAEALRQAQISLLSTPEYSHAYYWAAFLLVGSWL